MKTKYPPLEWEKEDWHPEKTHEQWLSEIRRIVRSKKIKKVFKQK